MSRLSTKLVVSLMVVSVMAWMASGALIGQDKGKGKSEPKGRLPDYYGKLELDEKQRDAVLKAMAKHDKEIDDLEAKIAALRKETADECEAVLTKAQKAKLTEMRDAAAAARKSKADSKKTDDKKGDEKKGTEKKGTEKESKK